MQINPFHTSPVILVITEIIRHIIYQLYKNTDANDHDYNKDYCKYFHCWLFFKVSFNYLYCIALHYTVPATLVLRPLVTLSLQLAVVVVTGVQFC